jgi:hypothetical protein
MSPNKHLPITTSMARFAKLKIILAMGPEKAKVPETLIRELRTSIKINRMFYGDRMDVPLWQGHKLHGKESE